MKIYRINENVTITEYPDKEFAKWQVKIDCSLDGKMKVLENSQCFNDFYEALIFVGVFCKGTEVNTVRYLVEFISDIVEHNSSRFKNTPIKKEVFDKLQKINNFEVKK
jgi:hypothetical protein